MTNRKVTAFIQTLLCAVGVLDAGTVYWAHRSGITLPCSSGGGCDLVNVSHWAFVYGVPVSLIGAIGYIVLLFASILRLTTDSEASAAKTNLFLLAASFLATCYSWYLQYVADVFIGAFCIYCRISAITMTLIFLTSLVTLLIGRRRSVPAAAAAGSPPVQIDG